MNSLWRIPGISRIRQGPGVVEVERRRVQSHAIYALTYLVVLLLVMAVVPILIASRAQVHRRMIADVIEPARIAAGELEAYSLERLLATTPATSLAVGPNGGGTRTSKAGAIANQWATLDSSAATLGGETALSVTALKMAMRSEPLNEVHSGSARAAALRTVDAAESLQESLDGRVADERQAALQVERWNVWLPMILVPLALAGVIALIMTGRAVVILGHAAQESATALADATEAKAALLRGVTHDLKNPLGAAQGFTELLSEGLLGNIPDRAHEAVQRVHRLLGNAIDIVSDLTELARAESGKLVLVSEATQLSQLLSECVKDYQGAARSRGLTLTEEFSGDVPRAAFTDPRRIRQILDNLLSNAIKYTPEGGSVGVALKTDDRSQTASITVTDTGPGIPEEMRGRVFDEFFRLHGHDAEGAPAGTGVGLAISRRLARSLGGDLTVDAAPSGGAVFTLAFRMSPSAEKAGA